MAWDKDVPGLVARAYHRVKCVRARSMTRAIAPLFCIAAFAIGEKTCINLLLAQMPCRSSEQVLAPFIAGRSFRIHLAERWLMAT